MGQKRLSAMNPEESEALTYYRCYMIAQDGAFGAVREAFTANDAEALEFGRQQLKTELTYRRAEVWQQGRLVGSLAR
jgi:hypothetical protein